MVSSPSDLEAMISLAEAALQKLNISVRREPIGESEQSSVETGGLCRIGPRKIVFVDSFSPPSHRLHILLEALRGSDLNHVYLPPAIRRLLDK